ncbi:autophagy-related protein 27 [Catenaria anguillulae PL171]|uniref:Autophagy-related protein 27 n=1 Tax=Catenaria anguillulae PL171 TaxID=765915 RepID=A0A1Y2H629_9FUNG|nr:autophagy-related protein 27 [Catenaria anguillulae PL171]
MTLVAALIFLSLVPLHASAAFNCADVQLNDRKFDISSIFTNDLEVVKTVDTPPSTTLVAYRVNPCRKLTPSKDVAAADTCSADTWACLVKTVKRDTTTLVAEVIGLVKGDTPLPTVTFNPGSQADDGSLLTLTYTGKRPDDRAFETVLRLECAKQGGPLELQEDSEVKAVFKVRSAAACPVAPGSGSGGNNNGGGKPADGNKPEEKSGGGFGSFLTIVFTCFVVYMLVGTLYRKFVLKVTGPDAIPHYDFWVELPGMIVELFHAIKNKVTGGQRGYIQV